MSPGNYHWDMVVPYQALTALNLYHFFQSTDILPTVHPSFEPGLKDEV
jgi:hypothetical protein